MFFRRTAIIGFLFFLGLPAQAEPATLRPEPVVTAFGICGEEVIEAVLFARTDADRGIWHVSGADFKRFREVEILSQAQADRPSYQEITFRSGQCDRGLLALSYPGSQRFAPEAERFLSQLLGVDFTQQNQLAENTSSELVQTSAN